MAALRPERGLSNGRGGTGGKGHRTESCLTMDEHPMALLKFRINKGNGWDEMIQDVLFLDIVDFYLFVGEGLLR